MTDTQIPEAVLEVAHARQRARERRDWPEADRLRTEIETAGWKVVDRGTEFDLSLTQPPDIVEAGRVRYGSSASVPSRLGEASTGLASVVVLATDWPDDLARALAGLSGSAPSGTQVIIVANAPSASQGAVLEDPRGPDALLIGGSSPETVWTSDRVGQAAALNAGIRRARAPVVILLDTSIEPAGDFVTPLTEAFADASVAVAGGWGKVSADLRHFENAPSGDVDTVDGRCQAFRRADYIARGPLDEHFRFHQNLDIWWSLVLRDEGEGSHPRRAVSLGALPLTRHERHGNQSLPPRERERLARRNFYRIIDRFGWRLDLLTGSKP